MSKIKIFIKIIEADDQLPFVLIQGHTSNYSLKNAGYQHGNGDADGIGSQRVVRLRPGWQAREEDFKDEPDSSCRDDALSWSGY